MKDKYVALEKVISLINAIPGDAIEKMEMCPSILLDKCGINDFDCDNCEIPTEFKDCRECWKNAAKKGAENYFKTAIC